MLLGVAIAFVVLVIPISLTHTASLALGKQIFQTTEFGMSLLREIVQSMEQLNYSVNFFLYVFGSLQFRKELAIILCPIKQKPTIGRSNGATMTSPAGGQSEVRL